MDLISQSPLIRTGGTKPLITRHASLGSQSLDLVDKNAALIKQILKISRWKAPAGGKLLTHTLLFFCWCW